MTRYVAAVVAAVLFTFTGQPSGARLLIGLATANLCIWVWGRVAGPARDEVKA